MIFSEGCHGHLAKQLFRTLNLRQHCAPQVTEESLGGGRVVWWVGCFVGWVFCGLSVWWVEVLVGWVFGGLSV